MNCALHAGTDTVCHHANTRLVSESLNGLIYIYGDNLPILCWFYIWLELYENRSINIHFLFEQVTLGVSIKNPEQKPLFLYILLFNVITPSVINSSL